MSTATPPGETTVKCGCTCGECAWDSHCDRLACRKTRPGGGYATRAQRREARKREAS